MVEGYDEDCEICKVFSNANRLKILVSLGKDPLNVNKIAEKTNLPQPVVSQHLSMMSSRGILDVEKKGSFVQYKIKYPELLEAYKTLNKVKKKIKQN